MGINHTRQQSHVAAYYAEFFLWDCSEVWSKVLQHVEEVTNALWAYLLLHHSEPIPLIFVSVFDLEQDGQQVDSQSLDIGICNLCSE